MENEAAEQSMAWPEDFWQREFLGFQLNQLLAFLTLGAMTIAIVLLPVYGFRYMMGVLIAGIAAAASYAAYHHVYAFVAYYDELNDRIAHQDNQPMLPQSSERPALAGPKNEHIDNDDKDDVALHSVVEEEKTDNWDDVLPPLQQETASHDEFASLTDDSLTLDALNVTPKRSRVRKRG